jgi:hypothetical protein
MNMSNKKYNPCEDCFKETWNDCRKYLHQTFVLYNWPGQHDAEMDEWSSPKELD